MKPHLLAAIAITSLIPLRASAETIYSSTLFRNLVSYDSAAPGTFLTNVPITGLVDQFESVIGIDFRPATGVLYAVGNAPGSIFRLYTLDTATGVATRIGSSDLTLGGNWWGIDFDPVADQIRLVSDANANVRINPLTGALSGTDSAINPSGAVIALAYDRNDTNAGTPTTLFGIDSTSDQLVRIGSVNGSPSGAGTGTVANIGSLGFNTESSAGFDIAPSGTAYAALSGTDPFSPQLYTVNLSTGAATLVGQIGSGSDGIIGLAVPTAPVPEPAGAVLLGVSGLLLGLRRRRS